MPSFIGKQLLRLLSFGLATILWFYVLNSEPIETQRRIKIHYDLPNGKAISSEVPQELQVKVRGARAFLRSLYDQEFATIDLTKHSNGQDQFSVNVGLENLPPSFGVTILSIVPKTFEVTLDKIIRKEVSIRETFVGAVPVDYKLTSHLFSPNKVMISGPISLMRKITSIKTEPIDLSRLVPGEQFQVALEKLDSRIIMEDGDSVGFSYQLHALSSTQVFKQIPLRFISTNRQIIAKQQTVDISVLVAKSESVNTLERDSIQAVIDIPERKKGWVKVKVRTILPADVHLLSVEPEEIMVKVK